MARNTRRRWRQATICSTSGWARWDAADRHIQLQHRPHPHPHLIVLEIEFWQLHLQAKEPLTVWHRLMRSAVFADFTAVRRAFGAADYVAPYTIFDIGGKREINARQARVLAQRFGVSAAAFI